MPRLRRADCSGPGITRRRRGRGFAYFDDGRRAASTEPEVLERIRELGIPPAWQDVWICAVSERPPAGDGHRRRRAQAVPLPRRLAHAARRGEVRRDGRASRRRCPRCASGSRPTSTATTSSTRERVLACAVRLLDRGFFRIGTEEYTVQQRVLRPGHDAQGARDARRRRRRWSSTTRPRAASGACRPSSTRGRAVVRALKRRRGGGDGAAGVPGAGARGATCAPTTSTPT